MNTDALAIRALAALPEILQRRIAGDPVEIDGQRLETEVQMMVRLREKNPRPPYDTLPVAEARSVLEQDAATVRGRVRSVASVRPVDAGGVPARLYVPQDDQGALLVYYHGGGWVLGSLDSHDATCRFLADEARIRVLSVDYRLAPEAKFPAAFEDALAAYDGAVANAAELGTDPGRVAVGGDSAGGNLAAAVAQLASPKPALQLLIYPVTDLSTKHGSYELFGEGFFLTERNMDWYRDHYLPDENAARDPRASPLLAEDLTGLPRTHLAIAGFDPLRDEALAYGRRLEAVGVDVEVVLHAGLIHGFANTLALGPSAPAAMRRAAGALQTL